MFICLVLLNEAIPIVTGSHFVKYIQIFDTNTRQPNLHKALGPQGLHQDFKSGGGGDLEEGRAKWWQVKNKKKEKKVSNFA